MLWSRRARLVPARTLSSTMGGSTTSDRAGRSGHHRRGRNLRPTSGGTMVQVKGMLSASELEERARSGDIDTILVVFPDLQGRLVGKRVTGHFWCEQMKAGDGDIHACNYLLAVDSEMTVLSGYRFANWEKGYGDFASAGRPRDDPRDPVARTHRARDVRPLRRGDRRADRGLAPPHPAAPGRAGRRARLLGDDGVGARVLPVQGVARRGRGEGLRRPHAALARDRGLPHPPDDPRRVPDPRHPQRDGRRGRAGRVLEGRGGQGPARDQPRLRRRGDDGRPSRDLQERRQGDRRAARPRDHVHGEVLDGRGRLVVPRALEPVGRRRDATR